MQKCRCGRVDTSVCYPEKDVDPEPPPLSEEERKAEAKKAQEDILQAIDQRNAWDNMIRRANQRRKPVEQPKHQPVLDHIDVDTALQREELIEELVQEEVHVRN